jgi:hypothetical protein
MVFHVGISLAVKLAAAQQSSHINAFSIGKDNAVFKFPKFAWPNMQFARMASQSAMLALESQQVIALRLARLAAGGVDAPREIALMVSEKMEAAQQSGQMMLSAGMSGRNDLDAGKIVQMYRKKVRANRRRLSR